MFRSAVAIPLIVGAAQFMHQFDGAVIATGSIYLVADLLSPRGTRRASAL